MWQRMLLIIGALVVAIPAVLLGLSYGLLASDRFVIRYALPWLSKQTGHEIAAARSRVRLFSEFTFEDARINCSLDRVGCPVEAPFALRANRISLKYDFWSLLTGRLRVTSFQSEGAHVEIRTQSGRANNRGNNERVKEPVIQAGGASGLPRVDSAVTAKAKPRFVILVDELRLADLSVLFDNNYKESVYAISNASVEARNASSNSDTTFLLRGIVTAHSKSLNVKNEAIEGAVKLQDSAMFQPHRIEVDLKAGSAMSRALEVLGEIKFASEPYRLQSIKLSRGIIRDSLFRGLGIALEPVSAFEYDISGNYSQDSSDPLDFKLVVNKHIFVGKEDLDLNGSTIAGELIFAPDYVAVKQGIVELVSSNTPIAKVAVSGNLAFDQYAKSSKLSIRSSSVDFNRLEAIALLFGKKSEEVVAPNPQVTKAQKLPLLDIDLEIEKSSYRNIPISNIGFNLSIPNSRQIDKADFKAAFGESGVFSASVFGSLDQMITFNVEAKKINVLPFAALVRSEGELLEGNLDSLEARITAAPSNPRQTISGHFKSRFSRFIVPSTLHGQVPFNIIFLPFDALITVFGGAVNAILPASISSISAGIREELDDAGRLGIDKGIVDLDFKDGAILCKQVEIDTKNLPDFTIKGRVTAEDRLDFTIFIGLLKLNLPLPVAGTLNTPLPDIVLLGPEIVRGLGLSVGNIATGAISVFTGSQSDVNAQSTSGS